MQNIYKYFAFLLNKLKTTGTSGKLIQMKLHNYINYIKLIIVLILVAVLVLIIFKYE